MARRTKRDNTVIVYLENVIYQAFQHAYMKSEHNQTQSEYMRALLISDLKIKGFLTDSMLAEMTC